MIKKHMMKNFGFSLCLWGLMGLALPGQGFSAPHRIKAEPSKPDTQLAGVSDKTRHDVSDALDSYAKRDCGEALKPLIRLWTARDLANQSPEAFQQLRRMRILCVLQGGEEKIAVKTALSLSRENIKDASAGFEAQNLHLILLDQDKSYAEAADQLEQTLKAYAPRASELASEGVLGLLMHLKSGGAETETAPQDPKLKARFSSLVDRLSDAEYQPQNLRHRLAWRFFELDRMREAVKASDKVLLDHYRTQLADQTYPYMVMASDAALLDPQTPAKSAKDILEAEITESKIALINHPEDLANVDTLAGLYMSNDQEPLAITLINRYVDLIDQNGLLRFAHPESYEDILIKHANLFADQGRQDEALEAFKAAQTALMGQDSFDFAMAYMNYLTDTGHEREALALETKLDLKKLDADQQSALASQKACAYGYMGDKANFEAMMAKIPDPSQRRLKPAICARDADRAAGVLIALTKADKTRDVVAMELQDAEPPLAWTPRDQTYVDFLNTVKTRPDVLAAAQAAHITIRKWDIRL